MPSLKPRITLIALAVASALLASCATPAYVSPVEVTRFTRPSTAELGHGTIAVAPAPGIDPKSLADGVYLNAVASQLGKLGYSVTASPTEFVALVSVHHEIRKPQRRGGPVSVGVGGSAGTYGSGVGLGIGLNLSGKPHDRIVTHLSVSIRPSAGGDALWEGRANFTASDNSDYANAKDAARHIAEALFKGFPGASGKTIEVK